MIVTGGRHTFFTNRCKEAAQESTFSGGHRLGAVLAINGKNFVQGKNHHRHTCKGVCLTSYHAERDALSKVVRGSRQCEKGSTKGARSTKGPRSTKWPRSTKGPRYVQQD